MVLACRIHLAWIVSCIQTRITLAIISLHSGSPPHTIRQGLEGSHKMSRRTDFVKSMIAVATVGFVAVAVAVWAAYNIERPHDVIPVDRIGTIESAILSRPIEDRIKVYRRLAVGDGSEKPLALAGIGKPTKPRKPGNA